MPVQQRRLKLLELTVGGIRFECQLENWTMDPGISDGDRRYTFCPDGQFIEDTDPEATLELTFFSDWRSNGISDWLTKNTGTTAAFILSHHPDIPAEHVTWSGNLLVKAPPVGGEARTTEMTEITLQIVGTPVYTREIP